MASKVFAAEKNEDKQQEKDEENDPDVFHSGIKMPKYGELDYPEITMSMAAMKAGAFHLGIHCLEPCREFMLCRHEEEDPRKCISEGKAVTRCGLDFFHKVKSACYDEFESYWRCVHHSGRRMDLCNCRKPQRLFDDCMKDNLGMDRPPVGYFTSAHGHDTTREKPQKTKPVFPNPTMGLPQNYPQPEAWHGSRGPLGV